MKTLQVCFKLKSFDPIYWRSWVLTISLCFDISFWKDWSVRVYYASWQWKAEHSTQISSSLFMVLIYTQICIMVFTQLILVSESGFKMSYFKKHTLNTFIDSLFLLFEAVAHSTACERFPRFNPSFASFNFLDPSVFGWPTLEQRTCHFMNHPPSC